MKSSIFQNLINEQQTFVFSVSNFKESVKSYEQLNISISANYECNFNITGTDIYWVTSSDKKNFSYRAPITVLDEEEFFIDISTVETVDCPNRTQRKIHKVSRDVNALQFLPSPTPFNYRELKSDFFASHNIGFGGIEITDRFTSVICYPTPADCTSYENELFGQDAHNMATGDFNNDGFEDIVVAWAIFPHTLESEQKINAPINIYLNDGTGNLYHDPNIYVSGDAPKHPFAYRLAVADFNNDGKDDIFAGSMGIQFRSEDYSENYINPYPHLLLLSNPHGKFDDASNQIEDKNDGKGQLCNFAHDASAGDPDGDGDIDIYACNILNINDGLGNFKIHEYINLDWQRENQFGNPMTSLLADLNNDTFDDIIFWNFDNRSSWSDSDEGYILLSNNSSDIKNWEKIVLPTGPFGFDKNKYNHAAAGDINNDGFTDVVVAITRDLPYYEGAYIQILINNGAGKLIDMTNSNFSLQPRSDQHHGEGNIYLRDMNLDGSLDIIHSTRDYGSGHHGAHIAINDGNGNFVSLDNSNLPMKPDPGSNNYDYLMKSLPINIDDEACIDFISVTDAGWETSNEETSNYFFSVLNINCNY